MPPAAPTSTTDVSSRTPSINRETAPNSTSSAKASCPTMEDAQQHDVVMYDDIERLVCHEDMPQLLVLATDVRQLYQRLAVVPAPTPVKASQMDPREVLAVVDRIQRQHCSEQKPTVYRGTFPLTDSIFEESLLILQAEVERCEQHLLQRQEHNAAYQHQHVASQGRRRTSTSEDATSTTTENGSIATKYAKWQTDILMGWMMEHKAHPFPTPAEAESLALRTCLNTSQIVNWTTNVRKRNRKATVAQGKRPRSFIDFLFLAQDRDQQNGMDEPHNSVTTVSPCPKSPHVYNDHGMSGSPTPVNFHVNHDPHTKWGQQDLGETCSGLSVASASTPPAKGNFVTPCISPDPLLDPWADIEENDVAHAAGKNSGSGPSALMDAFADYWFEQYQDHDDTEDDEDDKSAFPVKWESSKQQPFGASPTMRWPQNESMLTTTSMTTTNAGNKKRHRSTLFDDDDNVDNEWTCTTTAMDTTSSSTTMQDGFDVTDFIKELGLEEEPDDESRDQF